jgi:hypothetical protein
VWADYRRNVRGIDLDEPAHGGIVAQDRRCGDVAGRDFGMGREDRLAALQRAVPRRGLNEGRPRIVHVRKMPQP